jgi:hypothetical protein
LKIQFAVTKRNLGAFLEKTVHFPAFSPTQAMSCECNCEYGNMGMSKLREKISEELILTN